MEYIPVTVLLIGWLIVMVIHLSQSYSLSKESMNYVSNTCSNAMLVSFYFFTFSKMLLTVLATFFQVTF